ncbi:hypothetical protein BMS3Bbin07_01119 [bacterium BMS3Bbin07]|nr:hypothetical protein BMS3Bbin07_01119 [bacterium BMS3Bbin07]
MPATYGKNPGRKAVLTKPAEKIYDINVPEA